MRVFTSWRSLQDTHGHEQLKNKMNPFVNFIMHFVSLSDSDSNLLENELTYKKFKTGDKILQEGSICKNILFIVSGKARSFFINHEGQDLTWNFHFNDTESKFENYFFNKFEVFDRSFEELRRKVRRTSKEYWKKLRRTSNEPQEHITREFPSTLTSQIKIYIVVYYIPRGHPRSRNSPMNIFISI